MQLIKVLHFILKHPLNRGRPIATVARFAKWQIQSRIQQEVIFDWVGGAKLAVRHGMTGATGNIYCGLHEYVDMQYVLDTLGPNDLFVDIGANVGSYTVLASKACGAKTIAFEPDPDTADNLRRNIEVNGIEDRVTLEEMALGDQNGVVGFTRGRDTINCVTTSDDKSVRIVPIKRVDDILEGQNPTMIKIDVEGYEFEVFKGALKTLAKPSLRAIITETLDEETYRILTKAGFQRKYYDPEQKSFVKAPRFTSHNSLMVR